MIEDTLEEDIEQTLNLQKNQSFVVFEVEEEEYEDIDTKFQPPLREEEINAYLKEFLDVMQEKIHKRYKLRSKKRLGLGLKGKVRMKTREIPKKI